MQDLTHIDEHRTDERVPIRLEVQWKAKPTECPDVTTDISLGGCFVESLESVSVGEILKLAFCLPSKRIVSFIGEVRYQQPTIGFGVRFLQVSRLQRELLGSLTRQQALSYAA